MYKNWWNWMFFWGVELPNSFLIFSKIHPLSIIFFLNHFHSLIFNFIKQFIPFEIFFLKKIILLLHTKLYKIIIIIISIKLRLSLVYFFFGFWGKEERVSFSLWILQIKRINLLFKKIKKNNVIFKNEMKENCKL